MSLSQKTRDKVLSHPFIAPGISLKYIIRKLVGDDSRNTGDLVVYYPQKDSYPFGHAGLILGTETLDNDPVPIQGRVLQFDPKMYHVADVGGLTYDFYKEGNLFNFKEVGSPFLSRHELFVNLSSPRPEPWVGIIRYIGPHAAEVRAHVAYLTTTFIIDGLFHHGGLVACLQVAFTRCERADTEQLIDEIVETLQKFLNKELVSTVCSSMVILLYQIAFLSLGYPELVRDALPYSLLACRPTHILDLPKKYPAHWQLVQEINYKTVPISYKSVRSFVRDYPPRQTANWLLTGER